MSTYILILMFVGGSKAIATQEFSTKERCEAAAVQFVKRAADRWASGEAFCVPK